MNENTTKLINFFKNYDNDTTKSLTKKEERKLIDSLVVENPDKLKELLIVHNIRLVFKIAKRYSTSTPDFDEMVARGIEGLVYSTTKFDYSKNTKFSTYASKWIKKRILEEFNTRASKSKKLKKLESQQKSLNNSMYENTLSHYECSNEQNDYSLSSNSYDSSSAIQSLYESDKAYLIKEIECLVDEKLDFSENESTVYTRLILEGEPVKHVAKDLNLSVHNTMRLKNKVIEDIQTALKEKFNCELNELY